MIEDELRDVFARHEHLAPDARTVLAGIEQGYRRRRRSRLGLRAAGASLLVVALLGGSAYGAGRIGGSKAQPTAGPAASSAPAPGKPVNLLVLGSDARQNAANEAARSDIVAVVHIPANHEAAYVVTIERDTRVSIPADPGSGHAAATDKINAAYAWGGAQLAARTIEQNFGIHVDATVTFDFLGLQQIINFLGGVDLYVDARTTSIHVGYDKHGRLVTPFVQGSGSLRPVPGVTPVVYQVGYQHLQAWQAIDFARQRILIEGAAKGGYARDRHVRQLIQAVVKRIMSDHVLDDPAKLQKLIDVVQKSAALDTGGSTLTVLAALAGGISTIVGIGAPGTTTADSRFEVLTADGRALLDAVKGDTVDAWVAAHPDLIDVNH
jgi:polyisoprenyl-teichoic acid--peptidoglycan teichoic acid transferase